MTGTCQPAQVAAYFSMTASTPGILQPDRVEHPARRLGHARGRIADPRLEGRALAADRRRADRRRRRRRTPRRSRTSPTRRGSDWAGRGRARGRRSGRCRRAWRRQATLTVGRRAPVGVPRSRVVEPAERSMAGAVATRGRQALRPGRTSRSRSRPAARPSRPGALPDELLGGEDRPLAADPLRASRSRSSTTQPRHAPTAQPMFCSIETCRNALRRAAREPIGSALPPPRLRPSLATPRRSRRPAAWRASAASIGAGRTRTPGRPKTRTRARGRSRSRGDRASRRRWPRRTRPRRAAGSTDRPRASSPPRTAA